MDALERRIDILGAELVACRDGCWGIVQRQAEGILPRSLFLERPDAPGQGCVAVGLNPGTSKPVEREFYLKNGTTYDRVKEYRVRISEGRYFARTRSVIDALGLQESPACDAQ